jgi:hypothetical protein
MSGCTAPCILTPILDGGEWPASCPARFTPGQRVPGTHQVQGWMGPRADLEACTRESLESERSGIFITSMYVSPIHLNLPHVNC